MFLALHIREWESSLTLVIPQYHSQEGAAQPYQLADSISKALVTTWLGLVVAIPSIVAFSYFRNKIDSLVSECGKRVERILTPLSRKR